MNNPSINEVIKAIYQSSISNYLSRISELSSNMFKLANYINTYEKMIAESTNPIAKAQYQQLLETTQQMLLIAKVELASLGNNIIDLNQIYSQQTNKQEQPIITEEQKRIAESSTNIDNNLSNLVETRNIEIEMAFNDLKKIVSEYEKEKDITKKEKLAISYNDIKQELAKLKSSLSNRMRNALKNGKISSQEYEKFKQQQKDTYKNHLKVYREMSSLMQEHVKSKATQETKTEVKSEVKQEAKTEVKPEVKQEAKTEVKPEVKQETKTEVKPEVKQETKTEVKTEIKPAQASQQPYSKTAAKLSEQLAEAQYYSQRRQTLERTNNSKAENPFGVSKDDEEKLKYMQQQEEKAKKRLKPKNVDTDVIRQRNALVREIKDAERLYGTQNQEYQMRVEQLHEIDKKAFGRTIFGHARANKIYKELNKNIVLNGGSQINLNTAYLNITTDLLNGRAKL